MQLAVHSQLLASAPLRRYPEQLLSVDVCVTKSKGGNATAVDCPSGRNWKLAAGVKCGDKVVLPLGVVSGQQRNSFQSVSRLLHLACSDAGDASTGC